MLTAKLLSNLLRVSHGKAVALSGLLHVSALVLLAQSWMATTVVVPRLAGSRQASIQLDVTFRETQSPVPVIVPAMSVDVTPHEAHAFNRTFVDTPSAEIDWNSDVMARVAESTVVDLAIASATRASSRNKSLSAEVPQPIELPRSQIDPEQPRTQTAVPIDPGTHTTTPPAYDYIPPPRYPELARQRGWQGTVTLVVKIDATGQVTDVAVEQSSGYQLLDAAAVNAVKRWRYKPAIGRTGPVATEELQPVTFRLPR